MEALFSLLCHKAENGTHLAIDIKPWTWIRSWFLGKETLWFALISSLYNENKQNILKALRVTLCSLPSSFLQSTWFSSYSTFIEHLLRIKPCGLFVWAWICGKDSREDESLWIWSLSGEKHFFIDKSLDLKPRLNWYSFLSSQSPSLLPTQAYLFQENSRFCLTFLACFEAMLSVSFTKCRIETGPTFLLGSHSFLRTRHGSQ